MATAGAVKLCSPWMAVVAVKLCSPWMAVVAVVASV